MYLVSLLLPQFIFGLCFGPNIAQHHHKIEVLIALSSWVARMSTGQCRCNCVEWVCWAPQSKLIFVVCHPSTYLPWDKAVVSLQQPPTTSPCFPCCARTETISFLQSCAIKIRSSNRLGFPCWRSLGTAPGLSLQTQPSLEGTVFWGHWFCPPGYDLHFSIKDALYCYRASPGWTALFCLQSGANSVCLFSIFPVCNRAEPTMTGIHTYVYGNNA